MFLYRSHVYILSIAHSVSIYQILLPIETEILHVMVIVITQTKKEALALYCDVLILGVLMQLCGPHPEIVHALLLHLL